MKRTERLEFVLNKPQKAALQAAAKEQEMSVSDFLRSLIIRHIERNENAKQA